MKKVLYRLIFLSAILTCFLSFWPLTARADDANTKTIQVPIDKSYKSAKFIITFDYYDNYSVKLISPSGTEYKGTLVSDTEVDCVAEDLETGQWQIEITKQEATSNESDSASSGSSEETENTDREISPVKVKIEGSTETLVDVSSDITVAEDIAGLKMYFKDDTFVAEWTDTTCGSVNIEISNAKNMQKLASETVSGNSFEYPIEDGVEEIFVKIVPSVSAELDGASNTYSFVVDNNPSATVRYEELTLTNHDTIKTTCELSDKYSIVIYVNDSIVESTDMLDAGIYEYDVPIDAGENTIKTYIVDENSNMRSTSYTVTKDVIAPQLELLSTYDDIKTEDEYLTIEGKVNNFYKLMINNSEVEVEGDNTFKFDYKLKEGVNQISVIASDEAGNETEYDIAAERIIPEETPIPWIKIIICVSLLCLVSIYSIEVIKRKRHPERYNKEKAEEEEDEYSAYDDIDISGLSKKEKNEIIKGPYFVWDILSVAVPFIAAFVIMTFIIMISVVQSSSMEPKLEVGNTVFYNRLAYLMSEPQRGDVVVFYSAENGSYYGKRIIGLPGDTIKFRDGYVLVNDQYCDESKYLDEDIETNCTKEFEVPEGCYFMLGDNRENSYDARYWENPYISKDAILGKYMGQIDFSFQFDVLYRFFGN